MTARELIGALVVEPADCRPLEVVEVGDFRRDALAALSEAELDQLRNELATLRQLGSVIKDTNGLRKFRWGAKGKGKRGGVRVIYYYGGDHMPLFLIALYAKNEKADLTAAEKKAAKKLVEALKKEHEHKPVRLRVIQTKGRRR
jgi:mRNA-degrading endonuclease RelE of RelBE toxin-antitoxin system